MSAIPRLDPAIQAPLPRLSVAQMVEVDRLMVEEYRILLLQMMEHAGRHLAHLARELFLHGDARGRRVVVLAGPGGNGGGALVCARRLAGWGAQVAVAVTADDRKFGEVPGHQLAIARRLGLPVATGVAPTGPTPDLVIDGIIGYSLQGPPRGPAGDLIRWANDMPVPILALDVPSGLDGTSGERHNPTIDADATMTLALPKAGLMADQARAVVGQVYLADIGVPLRLYAEPSLQLTVPAVFAQSDLVRLR